MMLHSAFSLVVTRQIIKLGIYCNVQSDATIGVLVKVITRWKTIENSVYINVELESSNGLNHVTYLNLQHCKKLPLVDGPNPTESHKIPWQEM